MTARWGDTRDNGAWLYETNPETAWLRQAHHDTEARYAEEDRQAALTREKTGGDIRDRFEWLHDTNPETAWLRQAYNDMETRYAEEDRQARLLHKD